MADNRARMGFGRLSPVTAIILGVLAAIFGQTLLVILLQIRGTVPSALGALAITFGSEIFSGFIAASLAQKARIKVAIATALIGATLRVTDQLLRSLGSASSYVVTYLHYVAFTTVGAWVGKAFQSNSAVSHFKSRNGQDTS